MKHIAFAHAQAMPHSSCTYVVEYALYRHGYRVKQVLGLRAQGVPVHRWSHMWCTTDRLRYEPASLHSLSYVGYERETLKEIWG